MTFDSGTWWLIIGIGGLAVGALVYLVKRSIFGRMDKIEAKQDEIEAKNEKALKSVQDDIKKIKEDYITKDDFFREQNKTDRKLDRIMDILLELKGDKKNE